MGTGLSHTADGSRNRPWAKDHSRASPEGAIIDSSVLVLREIADIGMPDFDVTPFPGPFHHTDIKRAAEILGKKREDLRSD